MIGGNRVKGKMRKRRRDREHYTGRDDRDEGTIDAIRIHEAERALLSLLKGKQVDPDELYKRPRTYLTQTETIDTVVAAMSNR